MASWFLPSGNEVGMRELIGKGMKRRRREVRFVSVVSFVAVLLLCGIMLFQDVMNEYVFCRNQNNYGQWVLSVVGDELSHPYFGTESSITVGPQTINTEGFISGIRLGAAGENFEEIDGGNLLEGRMPEASDEITADIVTLSKLGYTYDLGQIITIRYRDSNERIQEKEYILVGTMRCFAEIWKKNGSTLCGADMLYFEP